jgi:Zn-dependent peptidase ImmA (M78 family)
MKKFNPLDDLFELYENLNQCSKSLGVSRQVLYYWKDIGVIPSHRGHFIEEKTGGKIKAEDVWHAAGAYRKIGS